MLVLDVELELTTLCNARCPLCYRNYKEFEKRYPETKVRDIKDVIAQLETFPDLEWVRLVGTISEPTLYKHFFELVTYIKSRDIKIEICTNGDTNNEFWWAELAQIMNSDDRVFFSICGSTQELHEIYREGTRLDKIIKNAAAFRTEDKNDYAQCIRFDYNSDNFDSDEFTNFVSVFSNIYMTETYLSKDDSNYVNTKNLGLLVPTKAKADKYYNIEKIANIGLSKKSYCKSVEHNSQQIDINGNIYPCYLFLEANGDKPWDGDYDKILNQHYDVCKFCEKNVMKMCMDQGLEYII
ncbi:MAG: radical SAM protein [Candidatus Marinimicrobia bacterium]|nr:radical SAM protein [Candidatus Neomarinimicrobiota bacterium]